MEDRAILDAQKLFLDLVESDETSIDPIVIEIFEDGVVQSETFSCTKTKNISLYLVCTRCIRYIPKQKAIRSYQYGLLIVQEKDLLFYDPGGKHPYKKEHLFLSQFPDKRFTWLEAPDDVHNSLVYCIYFAKETWLRNSKKKLEDPKKQMNMWLSTKM